MGAIGPLSRIGDIHLIASGITGRQGGEQSMRVSRLPAGGENILQTIRAKRAEAEAHGIKLTDLSIGEPKGAALFSARKAAAEAVMSEEEAMHAYQYNASPWGAQLLSPRFIRGAC